VPDVKIVNLDKTIVVGFGANLRQALLYNGVSPHKGFAKIANCHGSGGCCTCKVRLLRGDVSERSFAENWNPRAPRAEDERLSCQVRVFGDIEIDTLDNPPAALVGAGAGADTKANE